MIKKDYSNILMIGVKFGIDFKGKMALAYHRNANHNIPWRIFITVAYVSIAFVVGYCTVAGDSHHLGDCGWL
jgi:uncharacterized membrane protein YagU involved in acid resistance